ncbi:integral membrane [Trichoderma arundinaceum]|uniref:Integral membrane n=1 Tax=Trichoderma arundinaceum TaxID=490622 RepID=A0A395NKR6_TRIAR|nr:integral membrane [Trichoderma arundinaceum]
MAIENRGPQLQAACYLLLCFAVVSMLLRCYVRIFMIKSFGLDDSFMLFALITFILFTSSALVGVHYGTGRHYWDLTMDDISSAMKFWWFCYLWYCLTMIAAKLSVGYFLLRLMVRRLEKVIVYVVMLLTVLTGVLFFFVTLLQCHPLSFFWDKNQDGHCISIEIIIIITYVYSSFSVICDFTFSLLPIYIIWGLNMKKMNKVALIPIMAMACVASAAVIIRFPYVQDFKNPDFLYATVDIAIWSATEQGLAITAGSLATLRPLLRSIKQYCGFSQSGPTELKDSDRVQQYNRSNRSRGPYNSASGFPEGSDALKMHPVAGEISTTFSVNNGSTSWDKLEEAHESRRITEARVV